MNNKENLLNKLEYSARKYKFSRWQRFLKHPFISMRDALITILFNKILRQKIYFKVKAKTFWGSNFWCIFPESKDIYFYGGYVFCNSELRLTKFIIKNDFKEDLIFFDLGAHYGYYSVLFSDLYPESKIYAFEPDPGVLEILRLNTRENIEIISKAVSDNSGFSQFYSFDILISAISRLSLEELKKSSLFSEKFKKIEVETITLDGFCKERNVYPDFIKIDVEGAEYSVLKGADNILNNYSPMISLEVWFKPFTENYKNSIEFLLGKGYKMFTIKDSGDLENIEYKELPDYFKYLQSKYNKISDGSIFDNIIFKK